MPVKKNKDGMVTCVPPWSFTELLEVTGYEFRQEEDGIVFVIKPRGKE